VREDGKRPLKFIRPDSTVWMCMLFLFIPAPNTTPLFIPEIPVSTPPNPNWSFPHFRVLRNLQNFFLTTDELTFGVPFHWSITK
jgi:hypothetical protein